MANTDTIQTGPADQTFNEDLYNILMGAIEPDLATDVIPILDELYLGETEGEHTERMERYAKAIEKFKERSKEFMHDCTEAMLKIKDHAIALAKDAQATEDTGHIHTIEQSIEQS